MSNIIAIVLNVWVFVKANWVAILGILYAIDTILKFVGAITGNATITSWATMLGNWIAKLPQVLNAKK